MSLRVRMPGTNVGSPVDEYSSGEVFKEVDLGNWTPGTTSDKAFKFTVTGKNASSAGYGLAFDGSRLQDWQSERDREEEKSSESESFRH